MQLSEIRSHIGAVLLLWVVMTVGFVALHDTSPGPSGVAPRRQSSHSFREAGPGGLLGPDGGGDAVSVAGAPHLENPGGEAGASVLPLLALLPPLVLLSLERHPEREGDEAKGLPLLP